MKNYIVIALVAVIAYTVFFKDPYPSTVNFRGHTLGEKEDYNVHSDSRLNVFSYKDNTGHHVLIVGMRNESSITLDDISKQYLRLFQTQGVKFVQEGDRHLGVRDDEAIYIAEAKNMDAIVMYVEKGGSTMPEVPSDGSSVFTDLEFFTL